MALQRTSLRLRYVAPVQQHAPAAAILTLSRAQVRNPMTHGECIETRGETGCMDCANKAKASVAECTQPTKS
jgi:hypothetical protein